MVYRKVSFDITPVQLRKAAQGKVITLSAAQLKGSGATTYLHPENALKISKAKKAGRGTRLYVCDGAINHDIDQMQGASIWNWLKGAAKSVYKFGKDNWGVIKPIASKLADVVVPALATALGQPALAATGRSALKELTGVGIPRGKVAKGSQAAKDRMAALRAMRGGSFR